MTLWLAVSSMQTQPFYVLQLKRSSNVRKRTEQLLAVKCRGEPGTSFESQAPVLYVSTFLSPPQTVNWTLAACKPVTRSMKLFSVPLTDRTRHRASTSMYSLTFCVRVFSPERHHWKRAVQAAAVMLRTPPSTASHRPAALAHPAERSYYVVISRDGRELVTRVVLCCHSNATRAPIANPPNSAQPWGIAYTTPPSYIRVRAIV